MQNQVNNICRSSYLALHKIGKIRNFLDKQTTEKLVHAFISCRLDFCNSLLHCIPDSQTSKLQCIQNSAARLVRRSSSRQHIKPILRSLHWLPVNERIVFKILLLTHKCIHGSAPALALRLTDIVPSCMHHHRFGTLSHTISELSQVKMNLSHYLKLTCFINCFI